MQLSGADIVVNALIDQGCKTVFGYPGSQVIDIYDSLYKYQDSITHILTAHEQGATHASDGYARVTGKPGVVIATSGPGATNLVTGIATAFMDSVPMVVITGNVKTSQIGYDSFQEIDITGITLPITKHNYFVERVEDLSGIIEEAFSLSISGRKGPVLIDIPKNVQTEICEYVHQKKVKPDIIMPAREDKIIKASKIINSAKRPFVYFGGGMINSGAKRELKELIEKIDAPCGCSFMGLSGIETDYDGFLGMQGMHGHLASTKAMDNSDVIIALGTRFNDRVIGDRSKFSTDAKIIHIDVDSSEISKTVTATCGLKGDIKKTLKLLLPHLTETKHEKWQEAIKKFKNEEEANSDNREGMTPKNIINIINDIKKKDTPIITDVGQHQMWVAQYMNFYKERTLVSSGGLGTMGFGIGASIGSFIGTQKRCVLVTGDGSFGMSIQELATIVKHKIPVTIVLFNNGVLGMVRQWQTLLFDKRYSATTLERSTDFLKVCAGFGMNAKKVESLEEFRCEFATSMKQTEPILIECSIDKNELVLPATPPGSAKDKIIVKAGRKV